MKALFVKDRNIMVHVYMCVYESSKILKQLHIYVSLKHMYLYFFIILIHLYETIKFVHDTNF